MDSNRREGTNVPIYISISASNSNKLSIHGNRVDVSSAHVHGLHHWMAQLMTVISHSVHRHVHRQLAHYWFPKCVPDLGRRQTDMPLSVNI